MYTPSGRFQPDKRICFSMSDFHPGSVRVTLRSLPVCYTFMSDNSHPTHEVEPCMECRYYVWKLPFRNSRMTHPAHMCISLTGLLSFMLSDEMTTGSVNSSDADKKAYAARSHAWNIEQRKFKDAFPDVLMFSASYLLHQSAEASFCTSSVPLPCKTSRTWARRSAENPTARPLRR